MRARMASSSHTRATVEMQQRDAVYPRESPLRRPAVGREIIGQILPPLMALVTVVALWWMVHLVFPRLLPSPLSTFRGAVRLLSEGSFFFHMIQSLRRVFVGSVIAMAFSVVVGIYMGTVVMGERFFQPLVVLGLTIPGLMWSLIAVMLFGINDGVGYQVMKAYQVFDMEAVIAWTLTFVAAMILIEYGIINLAEQRVTRWRPKIEVWRR